MATQYWDSAQDARDTAQAIDSFLYVGGKTSPKSRELREHTTEEFVKFLDMLRENQWSQYHAMMVDMGWES